MNRPLCILTGGLLAPTILLAALWQVAAQDPEATAPRQQVGQQAVEAEATEDVNIRYSRAYLKLAELDLELAEQANRQFPGTYSAALLERLRENVRWGELRLERALESDDITAHDLLVQTAVQLVRVAETNLNIAERLEERVPDRVTPKEMERLRMAVEVARLAQEQAEQPELAESSLAQVQWQIDRLRQEVLHLHILTEELSRHPRPFR